MMIIGLTGPTGSGKTTALRVLEQMGFTIVDCDALYYELLKRDDTLRGEICAAFGQVFLPDGTLDRPTLAKAVFGDQKKLQQLDTIVARAMNAAVDEIVASCRGRGVVIDAIKLIESGLGEKCDLTVALTAPADVRLKRIMERDGIDEAYAKKRIDAQKKDLFYKKHCMFLLENRASSQREFERLIQEFFSDMIVDMEE